MEVIFGKQQTEEWLERELEKSRRQELDQELNQELRRLHELGVDLRGLWFHTFDDMAQSLNYDLRTYHNAEFMDAIIKIPFAHTDTPYPTAFSDYMSKGINPSIQTNLRDHLFQYHSTVLFKYWQQKSAVLYKLDPKTYGELEGDTSIYQKHEAFPFMSILDHPVQEKPFQPFLLEHHEGNLYSLLMWIDPKETLSAPNVPPLKRFKKSSINVKINLAMKNLHKGYIQECGKGLFVYVEYMKCWMDTRIDEIECDLKKGLLANTKALIAQLKNGMDDVVMGVRLPYEATWRTKVMLFDKATDLDINHHKPCLTHLNLLTCLQNPKTVVTQTNRLTKQQRKNAKRKREQPLSTKTLLVETETLHQINPLRAKSATVGGKHSYQYERSACEAKKWVLEANLETGMEVIAKKPRKNGDGYLYLVKGKRKGAVCNAHLPLKEKTVQTVKVKSFKI